jgi:triacylglycerol lipase
MKVVNPYKTTLDSGNAYWMARLASVAYIKKDDALGSPDEAKILADLQKEDPKFSSVTGFSKNSSQAILVEHKDFFTMAFRGTDELLDWLDNFELIIKPVLLLVKGEKLDGYFHQGFWKATDDIWEPLLAKYQQFQQEDRDKQKDLKQKKVRPLFLTGHSLGGAMATIAAANLIHQDLPFICTYTFGQPRAMTHNTARIINGKVETRFFRFQNNNDIVTRAPARASGYSHVGSFVYISEDKTLHDDIGWWYRFLDSVEGIIDAIPKAGLDGVEDHSMSDYLKAVQSWNWESK